MESLKLMKYQLIKCNFQYFLALSKDQRSLNSKISTNSTQFFRIFKDRRSVNGSIFQDFSGFLGTF